MHHGLAPNLPSYIRALRRYAMALCHDPTEADDLVQETLKRALIYLDDGRPIHNMRAYLFTVLHNVRIDGLSHGWASSTLVPIEKVAGRLEVWGDQLARVECHELSKLLQKLPMDQRKVILLIGLEGMSYKEAADVLGVPMGTVMSRLSRGRKMLRRLRDGADREYADDVAVPRVGP